MGVLYGVVLYVVMNFVVVPLSAIGFRPPSLMGVLQVAAAAHPVRRPGHRAGHRRRARRATPAFRTDLKPSVLIFSW